LDVFGSDSKYWSTDMKKALQSGVKGFPIPVVSVNEAAPSWKKIFKKSPENVRHT